MSDAPHFDDAERAAILEEWDRTARSGQPSNYGPVGCVVAILAVVLLVVIPVILRKLSWDLPPSARTAVLIILGLVALGGLLVGFLAGGLATGRVRARAEEAVEFLARNYPGGDASQLRHAAVVAILNAFYSGGPWTTHTYDFQQAAVRLGPALPYVKAVEHLLRNRRHVYPVFTADDSRPLPD